MLFILHDIYKYKKKITRINKKYITMFFIQCLVREGCKRPYLILTRRQKILRIFKK